MVLVVIGILTSSVVVSFVGRQQSYALQLSAEDLATAIRFATTQTKLRQKPHRVVFDRDGRRYRIEVAIDETTMGFTPVRGQGGRYRKLNDGVRIVRDTAETTGLSAELLFSPEAIPFERRVTLQNENGESVVIEVTPHTGQVHVFQKRSEE